MNNVLVWTLLIYVQMNKREEESLWLDIGDILGCVVERQHRFI